MGVKSKSWAIACLAMSFLLLSTPFLVTSDASPTVSLTFYKKSGYSAFGDMAGTFTAIARVSSDVVRVEFYLDNQLVFNGTSPPFQWDFDTSNYTLGQHHLEVVAYNGLGVSANASDEMNFIQGPFPVDFGVFLAVILVGIPVSLIIGSVLRPKRRNKKND